MKITFSDIDHDDLVICSELFVSIFKEPPWNEAWDIEDAFERLNTFFSSKKHYGHGATNWQQVTIFPISPKQRGL